uniref:Synaptotagmin XV n=1 Tax=Sphaeramia orbicularis TaxID=375764 RepID=A0A673CYL1_9TELE
MPPRFVTQNHKDLQNTEGKEKEVEMEMKMEAQRDILAHRGSLSVRSWYPVGTVLAGLYSVSPVAPPPGMATRLCFSVEYRHSSEQLMVSLMRLGNLPPRFHGNVTLVEVRLLPDDRRPRQAKARGTGPDPEFSDCFVFQVKTNTCIEVPCVLMLCFCLRESSVRQAGSVCIYTKLGDVQISLCYSPSLQRLSVVFLRARGLQLLTGAGVCVQVSLQIHTQVVKSKRSCVLNGEANPYFNYRMSFKLRPQNLDEACLRFELQQPNSIRSEPPTLLGVLVLGPFMYARGPQLQHWMDMVNTPQEPVKLWHGLSRPI